jgi:hypothetical protein
MCVWKKKGDDIIESGLSMALGHRSTQSKPIVSSRSTLHPEAYLNMGMMRFCIFSAGIVFCNLLRSS